MWKFLNDVMPGIENKTPTKINVLDAMWMTTKEQNKVTLTTKFPIALKRVGFQFVPMVPMEDKEDDLAQPEVTETQQNGILLEEHSILKRWSSTTFSCI